MGDDCAALCMKNVHEVLYSLVPKVSIYWQMAYWCACEILAVSRKLFCISWWVKEALFRVFTRLTIFVLTSCSEIEKELWHVSHLSTIY